MILIFPKYTLRIFAFFPYISGTNPDYDIDINNRITKGTIFELILVIDKTSQQKSRIFSENQQRASIQMIFISSEGY